MTLPDEIKKAKEVLQTCPPNHGELLLLCGNCWYAKLTLDIWNLAKEYWLNRAAEIAHCDDPHVEGVNCGECSEHKRHILALKQEEE